MIAALLPFPRALPFAIRDFYCNGGAYLAPISLQATRAAGPDIPLNLLGSLRDIFAMPYVPGTQAKRDVFGFFSNLTRDFPDAYALWVFHPLLPFSRANFTINDPRLVQKFMEEDLKVRAFLGASFLGAYRASSTAQLYNRRAGVEMLGKCQIESKLQRYDFPCTSLNEQSVEFKEMHHHPRRNSLMISALPSCTFCYGNTSSMHIWFL